MPIKSVDEVIGDEFDEIKCRRLFVAKNAALRNDYRTSKDKENYLNSLQPAHQDALNEICNRATCGLALSGGGIRSAAFNVGVLQALKERDFLRSVDYLSTVSGGGYAGSALTYYMQRKNGEFPFCKRVDWIRNHASYLAPGQGLNRWAIGAAVLRGVLLNAALLLPLLLVGMWALSWSCATDYLPCLVPGWLTGKRLIVVAALVGFVFVEWVRMPLGRWSKLEKLGVASPIPMLLTIFLALVIIGSSFIVSDERYAVLFVFLPVLFAFGYGFLGLLKTAYRNVAIRKCALENPAQDESQRVPPSSDSFKKGHYVVFEILAWSAVFGAIYWLLGVVLQNAWPPTHQFGPPFPPYPAYMAFLGLVGCVLLSRLVIANIFYAALSQSPGRMRFADHRFFSAQYGDYGAWGAMLLLVGLIPLLHAAAIFYLRGYGDEILSALTAGGVVSTVAGWMKRGSASELHGYVARFLQTGVILLLVCGLLWAYHFVVYGIGYAPADGYGYWFVGAFLLWVLAVIAADINYVSMHRYYRNRLIQAFFPPLETNGGQLSTKVTFKEIKIGETGAPYHIVNANVVTVGSEDWNDPVRPGENFIFSPLYIGANSAGWAKANCPGYGNLNLGTAMAISGAAVDPNTGATRSWPLRIVMGLLNVRLGYWLESPKEQDVRTKWSSLREIGHEVARWFRESWISLVAREIIGSPRADWKYVRLSDGGHFENLGLYELIRRKCRLIIVSDASADPNWHFGDLARAVERVRVDLRATIHIDADKLKPRQKTRRSTSPYVVGKIDYDDGSTGCLIFLKTTLFHGLPEDVNGYARQQEKFPDEPTTDQFFEEEQFEAYRELGRHAALKMLEVEQSKMTTHLD